MHVLQIQSYLRLLQSEINDSEIIRIFLLVGLLDFYHKYTSSMAAKNTAGSLLRAAERGRGCIIRIWEGLYIY